MGVASGCGEQEAGVASGSGWNLWVWLLGVVVRRYIDYLSLLLLYLFFFAAASLLFVPLMQNITNTGITRARYTITHFKHHHRVLRLLINRMSV